MSYALHPVERLSYDREHARVTYRAKQGEVIMDPVEFIGHLLAHVPELYEYAARYKGGYSNHFRHRMWCQGTWEKTGERADCNEKAQGKLPDEEKDAKRPSASWARLIRKIWGENPINYPGAERQCDSSPASLPGRPTSSTGS
jgi:hypothetical protein